MTAAPSDDIQTVIDQLLAEQRSLTAVERFAQQHQLAGLSHSGVYRDLLPARAPAPGEQYAFAVDLDRCSGCKACVTACHNLNGLEEDETWRSVGLLHGQANEGGFQQTITTTCHHCVEPACLNGCPVLAYEKDPFTGIVRHLDDQCIGCQYCVLKCPYDVPKYNDRLGIVRKCDMCSNRLAAGEPPACVQGCPNGAIAITFVSQAAIIAEAREGIFLQGAPDPVYTQPTTRYQSRRGLPAGLAPADTHALKPGHSHPALIFMLVLTQLSVGVFCVELILRSMFAGNWMVQVSAFHAQVALAVGLLALAGSTLHLGRPLHAWRAVVGLRTSWLSREILVFSIFAGLAIIKAAGFWLTRLPGFGSAALNAAVALSGLVGVFCSVMIYHDTRRAFWRAASSGFRFYGSTIILGAASVLFVTTLQGLLWPAVARQGAYTQLTGFLSVVLASAILVKLGWEASIFRHLRVGKSFAVKQTALLMSKDLAEITTARFLLGATGGVLLPLAFLVRQPAPGLATLGVTVGVMAFTLLGEVLERYLFFSAVVPERMPGGVDH